MASIQGTTWVRAEELRWNWWGYLPIFLPTPLALVAELGCILGVGGLADSLGLSPPRGDFDYTLFAWTFGVAVPLIGILVTINGAKMRICTNGSGIVVASLFGKTSVRWNELKHISPVYRNQADFSFFPTGGMFDGSFWVTTDHAKVLLTQPNMKRELISAELWAWIGMHQSDQALE